MIRITRDPTPPAELLAVRAKNLPIAQKHVAAGTLDVKKHLIGYEVAKGELHRQQHRKCCYCEKWVQEASFNDLEHFRPKSKYWWLTWEWLNLMFACPNCNRGEKNDEFPLRPGSPVLLAPPAAAVVELPWLIDPADAQGMDPLDVIAFKRVGKQWWPYGCNPHGDETVRVLGLARPALLTEYSDWVEDHIIPGVENIMDEMERGMRNADAVSRVWRGLTRTLFHKRQQYLALSYHALPLVLDEKKSAWRAFGLTVPRPPLP
jgi:hypothetical protein